MPSAIQSIGLATLCLAWAALPAEPVPALPAPRATLVAGYKLIVSPVLSGHPSAFPRCMDAQGFMAGHAGTDPWDNVAAPMFARGDQIGALRRPFGSLNFALGMASRRLIVGTSALQPVAWVDGLPTVLASVGGLHQGEARDANRQGAICGTLVNDITGQQSPVHWPSATAAGSILQLAGGTGGAAFSISESGRLAGALTGGAYSAFGFVGARWDGASQVPTAILPLPGAVNCEMIAVNEDGDTAGRCSFPNFSIQAVMHRRQTNALTGLGFLPGGTYSEARAIDNGRVVVGTADRGGIGTRAFRWENGVMVDLNDLVLATTEPIIAVVDAVAILDDGRIAAEVLLPTPGGPSSRMALLTPAGP